MTRRFQWWFVAIISSALASAAFAEEKLWVGSVSTDWFEPGNWSPPGVPNAADTVLVYSNVVTLSSDVVIDGLAFTRGRIEGAGNLTVTNCSWSGGAIAGSGILVIPPGGLLILPAVQFGTPRDLERTFENSGTVKLTAGNLGLRALNGKVRNFGSFEMYSCNGL